MELLQDAEATQNLMIQIRKQVLILRVMTKKDSGKKVTVVTSGTGEPYSLISDDGKWTGIDAEMWDEIEKRTGWEVEVKQASFDAMWGELDTGRADVVANCLAVKEERTDKYNATIPYYGDSQCIIVMMILITRHLMI